MKALFRFRLCLLLAALPGLAAAQNNLHGYITDTANKPVKGIAISLIYPADSTLAAFGVSGSDGSYSIAGVAGGSYLLQAAGIDFQTHYQPLTVPVAGNILPNITMKPVSTVALQGVQVNGEKIPILLKKDTIEYNAGSFKTKPDAAVEELLKKLPGVQVDKAGNIKAGGKEVQHVLVDGKEFFGDDPKVATKNLPADAIDKVQVFDALSQQAQYTGIDDGERDKTINLKLKESKRRGYFGDVEAGGGTDERFKLAGHYYRFKKNTQLAALGTLNNINQFGFTLQDYISFSGGLNSLLDGNGGLQLGANAPVSFGQQVTGLITSGAGGLNYTYESKRGRYNFSYMGNGADKRLDQQTHSRNFAESGDFIRDDRLSEHGQNMAHSLSYNLRQDLDTSQQLRFSGTASYATGNINRNLQSESGIQSTLLNHLDSRLQNDANGLTANGTLSYTRRSKGRLAALKLSLGSTMEQSFSGNDWCNTTSFFQPAQRIITDAQYQRNNGLKQGYNVSLGASYRIGANNYIEPELRGALGSDALQRRQGLAGNEEHSIDSLSAKYGRHYNYARPGITFRHGTEKLQYSFGLREEIGSLISVPEGGAAMSTQQSYLLPFLFWQYNLAPTTSINASYSSNVVAPTARQMLPLTDYTNPLQRLTGNPALRPEYQHNARLSYHRFDNFSFTSLMAYISGRYVRDKINLTRTINPDLSEDLSYANFRDDYSLNGHAEYSMPVRRLGINLSLALNEQFNRGTNMVNEVLNTNTTFTHGGKVGIGNRKKEHWDAEVSLAAAYTDSKYSLQQSLNTSFVQYIADARLEYRPNSALFFSASANVERYQSTAFADAITVPLLQASASWYFLKARRGALTLDAFDLLDRNRGIQRFSRFNYLVEERSNTIGRYFLLSFKYRLSATGRSNGGGGVRMMVR